MQQYAGTPPELGPARKRARSEFTYYTVGGALIVVP
jgi:hypothetical protein